MKQRLISPLVVNRAKSVGATGEAWLANLSNIIFELEKKWHISVGKALSGGTHAFVAQADGENGEKYVLKIDMPEDLGEEFSKEISVLKTANGKGYSKLYAYDIEKKACLLERLGKPIDKLDYTIQEKLQIICKVLQNVWELPVGSTELTTGNTLWFNNFLEDGYVKLNRPCSRKVIEQALVYLKSRAESENPDEFFMLHGDAHGGNTLKTLSREGFKFVDPDGLFYEKAYDLGILMREWCNDYEQEPVKAAKERSAYLHHLTGVSEQAIWEWGYIQIVSTAFVMLQIRQEKIGHKMLHIAEHWTNISSVV